MRGFEARYSKAKIVALAIGLREKAGTTVSRERFEPTRTQQPIYR